MAETKTKSEREAIAKQYFKRAFSGEDGGGEVDFKVQVNAKTITAQARYSIDNSLMKLAGVNASEISVSSEVSRAVQTTVEVAMVLDYSWSMTENNKYSRMAQAAREMVDSIASRVASGKFKVGIVPFSAMVYTSMPSSMSRNPAGPRRGRAARRTATTRTIRTSFHRHGTMTRSGATTIRLRIPAATTAGLTRTATSRSCRSQQTFAVRTKLANMYPVGNTNIPLGVEFGYNLLDPAQPYTQGNPYSDKQTQKYLIILTDGIQTSKQSGSDGTRSVENGNKNLVELCKKAKHSDIEVFAIAYDVTDPAITNLLRDCAKTTTSNRMAMARRSTACLRRSPTRSRTAWCTSPANFRKARRRRPSQIDKYLVNHEADF